MNDKSNKRSRVRSCLLLVVLVGGLLFAAVAIPSCKLNLYERTRLHALRTHHFDELVFWRSDDTNSVTRISCIDEDKMEPVQDIFHRMDVTLNWRYDPSDDVTGGLIAAGIISLMDQHHMDFRIYPARGDRVYIRLSENYRSGSMNCLGDAFSSELAEWLKNQRRGTNKFLDPIAEPARDTRDSREGSE